MKYSTLCETLLPLPVQEEMKQIDLSYNHAEMEPYWWRLLSPRQWKTGIEKLTQVLGEDPKGFRLLNCQLHCAMNTYRQYRQKGIPESIFWEVYSPDAGMAENLLRGILLPLGLVAAPAALPL